MEIFIINFVVDRHGQHCDMGAICGAFVAKCIFAEVVGGNKKWRNCGQGHHVVVFES